MCMEDVRIGRAVATEERTQSITNTAVFVIDEDPNRYSITFFAHPTDAYVVSSQFTPTASIGMNIPAGSVPLHLNIRDHGHVVTKGFQAIGPVGGITITFLVGTLEKQ